MTRAAHFTGDLQRGIRLAFAVPETHVAIAIGYLLCTGPAREQFSDEICGMFEELTTSQGWSLCAGLLKVRLELRAAKLCRAHAIQHFYQLLEYRRC